MSKRYLITSALPYANGPLHFGHLAGAYLPADVYTRHRKLQGEKVIHISGSDEHGVAIMLNAKKDNTPYKQYVDRWHKEHKALFDKFEVAFDFFGQTSEEYHYEETKKWFHLLNDKGYIGTKENQQLYCNDCHNHLPDRFVEGVCYSCGYESARGDECPNCGLWIEPEKLKNPVCKICGSHNLTIVPVTQYYLLLSKYHKEFRAWFETHEDKWRKTVYPYVDSLSKEELTDRAITRDLDWGIDVPLPDTKGKKLYVWFDAPIGYVSNTKELMKNSGEDYLKDWWQNPDSVITHFIGKDNIIFHSIIFPMMSMASGRALPVVDLPANQYLNLNSKQFSKSTGNYVDADEAVTKYGPDALRYYLLSIAPENSDSNFTWDQMIARNNGELANNIGNLISRCLKFWKKNWPENFVAEDFALFFDGDLSKKLSDGFAHNQEVLNEVQLKRGLENLMALSSEINLYFTKEEPWAKFKTDQALAKKVIAATGISIYLFSIAISPYLPTLSRKIGEHFSFAVPFTKEDFAKIYRGDFSGLKDHLNGVAVTKEPQVLVPKIELPTT